MALSAQHQQTCRRSLVNKCGSRVTLHDLVNDSCGGNASSLDRSCDCLGQHCLGTRIQIGAKRIVER